MLNWTRYIDVVEGAHKVWVHFRGPDNFAPGVDVKGVVKKIDPRREQVTIQFELRAAAAHHGDGPAA
jgi:hypothetical protein